MEEKRLAGVGASVVLPSLEMKMSMNSVHCIFCLALAQFFRGQGSCLETDPCHERWGKELLLPLQESINRRTHILAPGSVGPICIGFPAPTSTPTPAPAWQESTYLMGWTESCWSFPFLGSFPPTFIFLKTYTLLLTAVNYNLSEKKKNS